MNETLTFSVEGALPSRAAVYENQGIPAGTSVSSEVEALFAAATALFRKVAAPVGILAEVTRSVFADVYQGEGANEQRTPVADIFPRADHLALCAVTAGSRASEEIGRLFQGEDFALAAMLDAVASCAADKVLELARRSFLAGLIDAGRATRGTRALCYSPGYCGWHVSGQKELFAILRPERIGITLNDSCLMQPLKSVSGVIIAGPGEAHCFEDDYPCCGQCTTRLCRQRIRTVLAG